MKHATDMIDLDQLCGTVKKKKKNNNNNNIYLTEIEFSPGGSGFDTYTRNLNFSV